MKLLTEYLERAVSLERMAGDEPDSTFRAQLLDQTAAYRKLAAKRANDYDYGLPALPTTQPVRRSSGGLPHR